MFALASLGMPKDARGSFAWSREPKFQSGQTVTGRPFCFEAVAYSFPRRPVLDSELSFPD